MHHPQHMIHNTNGTSSAFKYQRVRGRPTAATVNMERDQPARARGRPHDQRTRPTHRTTSAFASGYPYGTGYAYQQPLQNGRLHTAQLRRDSSNSSHTSVGSDRSNRSESPIAQATKSSPLSPPPKYRDLQLKVVDDEPQQAPRIGDGFLSLPSPTLLLRPLTPVEPVTPRTSPLKSKRILFLDVDGVLLSAECQQKMKEGERIEFNPNVKEFMTRIAHETKCDIVVSSSWQFYPGHLQELNAFLVECGWRPETIHTLMSTLDSDITRQAYEEAPYCQSRSRGIMKAIEKHSTSIENWVAIDDLPLASTQHVCVPQKEDLNEQAQAITEGYMNHIFSYFRDKENIRQWRNHVLEQVWHAMTVPAHGLFSWKSLLFGFELNEQTVRVQAKTICDWIEITRRITDIAVVQRINETVMTVIHNYCMRHCSVQGYPHLREHFIQTDMNTGLTEEDTEKVISILNGRDTAEGKNVFQTIFSPRSSHSPSLGILAEDEQESSPSFSFPDNVFAVPQERTTTTPRTATVNEDVAEANDTEEQGKEGDEGKTD